MQGIPIVLLDGQQLSARQETDTAYPRPVIPIYLLHSAQHPFCMLPSCFCQQSKLALAQFYRELAKGGLSLRRVEAIPQDSEPARVLMETDDPCHLYGHSWQQTGNPAVKQCSLCQVSGYCPGCSPVPVQDARPFSCTLHAQEREVPR